MRGGGKKKLSMKTAIEHWSTGRRRAGLQGKEPTPVGRK